MVILEHKPSRYSFCPNYIKQSGAEKIFYNQQKDREILPWKSILHFGIPGFPLSFGVVGQDTAEPHLQPSSTSTGLNIIVRLE